MGWFPRSVSNRLTGSASGYAPATSPRLRRRHSPWASRQAVVTDLTTLSHTISGLASGIEHTVRVLAYNHNGDGAASDTTATPTATDTTPPVLSSVTVDRATITIVYNEALDGASEPTAGAFTVNVGTTVRGVSTVEVSGRAATLTLASAVDVGETVTVDYTVPTGSDASPLRDQAENDAGGLTGRQARNHTTAVTIVADPGSDMTYIVGDAIRHQDEIDVTVTFGESVQVTGTPELTLEIGDVTKQARYLDGSGSYSLAFRYTVTEGDEDTDGLRVPAGVIGGSGTIRYVADSSEAPALVELATQSGHKVDGIRPTLVTAGADANTLRLTLTWDKALDEDSVPSPHSNAFRLSVNGDRRGITGVSVDGKVVTLILASSVMSGDDATVSYGVPFRTYDPLKDILGNYAGTNSATVAIGDDTTPPTVSGDTSISYAENRTDQVASYSATDPENETVTWAALAGADAGDFAIADGVLTFRQSPDHEQPADSNRDNVYLVTVRAWDGNSYGTLDVTVTVTNVNEAAVISGDASPDYAENRTDQVASYSATDSESSPVTLSPAGTDAGDFELSSGGVLTFRQAPNYESPADSGRNNVYWVTVRAWDGNSYGTLDVVVTVTNEDEDGTVSLSSLQPQAGTELEADLSDPDGSVTATTWVWERSTSSTGPWSTIGGATSDAYTPADADLNRFLRVTASYTNGEGSGKTAEAVSTNQVQPAPIMNTRPEFPTSETGQREVEENTPAGRDIGDPVAAVDTDVGDTLTYKLDGTDAAAFDIDELSGQLRTKTALDYENKRSYSMTLTVTDTSGADDSITLRVSVTNIDEPPDLSGPAAVDYDENNRGTVASYTAVDPERATITWTLAGDDQDDFRISSRGVLTFTDPPDYETPTDSNVDSTYEVAVQASDGTNTPTQTVSVRVTNLDEGGTVTLTTTTSRPQVDTVVEAALDDPDGGIRNTVWRWERSTNRRDWTPIGGTNTVSYIPASADVGQYLQASATYDDDEGSTKTASAHTTSTVIDPTQPSPPPPSRPPTGGGSTGGGSTGGGPAPPPPGSNQPPEFTEGSRTSRAVAENSPAGANIGTPVTAEDPEGDPLTYKLAGTDAGAFDLDTSTGRLKTKAALDYETKNSYRVTVEVRDSKDPEGEADRRRDDSIAVNLNVANRDDTGYLTLSAPTPRAGQPLASVLVDPDGVTNISWVWERSTDRITWVPIPDATSAVYTPDADDEGHQLRVAVSYGDPFGSGKTAAATPHNPVTIGHAIVFSDVAAEGVHTPAVEALAVDGTFVDTECGQGLFCPQDPIRRSTMAIWLIRVLGGDPPTVGDSRFDDIPGGQWWIRHVEQLADREITAGCATTGPPRYCPDQSVTRAQMATFLVRAFQLAPAQSPAGFGDIEGNTHAANIDALAAAGITAGCSNDPLLYCPNQAVTRAQMATFLHRALNHQPSTDPTTGASA